MVNGGPAVPKLSQVVKPLLTLPKSIDDQVSTVVESMGLPPVPRPAYDIEAVMESFEESGIPAGLPAFAPPLPFPAPTTGEAETETEGETQPQFQLPPMLPQSQQRETKEEIESVTKTEKVKVFTKV